MNSRQHTYTIFARFPDGTIEEVDVHAASEREAREAAAIELTRDYIPGWSIVEVVERIDGTFFM